MKDKSRLRQLLRQTEESRKRPLQIILHEDKPLRQGSFYTIHRKCGKPNCHCATGKGHEGKYLSIRESGRTRLIFIPRHLEVKVADEAWRYRRFRQARADLAKLAKQSLKIIDDLEQALESTEEIPTKRKKRNKGHRSNRKTTRRKS